MTKKSITLSVLDFSGKSSIYDSLWIWVSSHFSQAFPNNVWKSFFNNHHDASSHANILLLHPQYWNLILSLKKNFSMSGSESNMKCLIKVC